MGDQRWGGTFGVNVDFVARSHCSVEMISLEDMQVSLEILVSYDWGAHVKSSPDAFSIFSRIYWKNLNFSRSDVGYSAHLNSFRASRLGQLGKKTIAAVPST